MKTTLLLPTIALLLSTASFSQQKANVGKHYLEIGYSSSIGFIDRPHNDLLGFGILGGYTFKSNNNYYFAKARLNAMAQISFGGKPDEPATSFSIYEIGYGHSLNVKKGELFIGAGISAITFVSRGQFLYSYGGGGWFGFWGSTHVYERERTTYLGLPIELKYVNTYRAKKLQPFVSLFANINKGGNIYGVNIGLMLKLSK